MSTAVMSLRFGQILAEGKISFDFSQFWLIAFMYAILRHL